MKLTLKTDVRAGSEEPSFEADGPSFAGSASPPSRNIPASPGLKSSAFVDAYI